MLTGSARRGRRPRYTYSTPFLLHPIAVQAVADYFDYLIQADVTSSGFSRPPKTTNRNLMNMKTNLKMLAILTCLATSTGAHAHVVGFVRPELSYNFPTISVPHNPEISLKD